MLKMAIKSVNGYVYFNELLYRCMRRKYGNMKINKKMQIFELLTQYRIYLMTLEKLRESLDDTERLKTMFEVSCKIILTYSYFTRYLPSPPFDKKVTASPPLPSIKRSPASLR